MTRPRIGLIAFCRTPGLQDLTLKYIYIERHAPNSDFVSPHQLVDTFNNFSSPISSRIMSEITFYDSTVQLFSGGLASLVIILKKAQEHSDAALLPSAKLYDDMKPLTFQVESAIKTVSRCMVRAANIESIETVECDEMKLDELIAYVEKTLAVLKAIDPKEMIGKEKTEIELSFGTFTGREFVFAFGIPSFFFHVQTAYSILRMKGVPLGKVDYMDSFKVRYGA